MNKQQNPYFNLLDLDTKLFGFKVAKILASRLTATKLGAILNELQTQDVRLVYWPSDSGHQPSQRAAQKFNGFLSSEQVTYLCHPAAKPAGSSLYVIEAYKAKTPSLELKQLALQAGTYSRFWVDPNFPKKLFVKLYATWIKNSVNGTVASKVYVIRHKNKVVGMITLGTKNNRGDIGLLAINAEFRGKNLGTKLVSAAQNYFIEQSFTEAQVVTQKSNIPACHLYRKCGFHQEKIENFYHFWLC